MAGDVDYSYESIQPDQLRLFRFVEDDNRLGAILEPFPGSGHPPYVALSYAWRLQHSGANDRWSIRIGERNSQSSVRWDHQTNLQERGEHVKRMKYIYQNAREVVVWLGPESDDSDLALDFIKSLNGLDPPTTTRQNLRAFLLQDQYQAKLAALRNFFARTWWTRIWTVQELIVSSNVNFWCGRRQLTRKEFSNTVLIADRCRAVEFKGTIAFYHAFHRRRAWALFELGRRSNTSLFLSLVALAAYFCGSEATDDRDRVYGLLALSTENHGIKIDYTSPVDEVYLRFAQSFIMEHKSLDILGFASLFVPTQTSSLPSWVPDWRRRVTPFVVPLMVSQSSNDYIGNLRPPENQVLRTEPARYSASGSRVADVSFRGSTLIVRGCVIDAVDALAVNGDFELVQSSEQHSQISEGNESATAILQSICRSLTVDRGDRYLSFVMDPETFYRDFLHLCLLLLAEDTDLVYEPFQKWFRSTRSLLFHGCRLDDLLCNARGNEAATLLQSAPNQDEQIRDSFYGRFFDVVERWALRLMTTRHGRIGMATPRAAKGDLICVLFGCSVPMILRRAEKTSEYTIIGECYLDGCMNGEAIEQGVMPEEVFHLV